MHYGGLFAAICVIWVGSELTVAFMKHARGGNVRDRGSLRVLWIAISLATVSGAMLSGYRPTRMPDPLVAFWAGIGLIVLGIAVRAAAIASLWRHFTVNVAVTEDQQLVQRGLYRYVRHPSYTGSIISFLGLGTAFGNWLSLAIIVLVTGLALAYRIRVEEQALIERFGDAYREYMRRTKRLIPGVI